MRAQVTMLLGLVLLVAAAWTGLGRVGGAVALAVAGGVVLVVGILASAVREGGPDGRP